jgi:hypothetical protein
MHKKNILFGLAVIAITLSCTNEKTIEINNENKEVLENNNEETYAFKGAVKVVINKICQKASCWINITVPGKNEAVMVFFRDHFTVPIETSAGKEAVLYGALISNTLSVDIQKHLLDNA